MADQVLHAFVSTKPDSSDPTLVSSNEWNEGHVFAGGINGQVLIYDDTMPNNMRWTDGAKSYTTLSNIVNGTTSPQNNYLTINFTSNSAIVINLSVFFNPFTTGAVASIYTLNVDGTPYIGAYSTANGEVSTQYRTLDLAAGTHTIDLDISTVGNVTWTAGLVYIAVSTFGI